MCNGVMCGFAEEVREEIAIIHTSIANVKERMTAFEGYLDRIASMVQNTHRDTMDIRRTLRVIFNRNGGEEFSGEMIPTTQTETDYWLGRTKEPR